MENKPAQVPVSPVEENKLAPPTAGLDRRSFIKWATIGWMAFAAVVAGYGSLVLRYLFPNVLFEPKQSFRAGYPDDYEISTRSRNVLRTLTGYGWCAIPEKFTRFPRYARIWGARLTGWRATINLNVPATAVDFIKQVSISRARRPGRWSVSG